METKTICVFGDSTSWGAWDCEKGGWVNRLWFDLAQRDDSEEYIRLFNLSIDGGTTETVLARFENEAKIRKATHLIFQTGGNDSAGVDSPENYRVPPEQFRKNIEEIISRAKKITPHIIFTDIKNCIESKTTPVSWMNHYYTNEAIQKYLGIIKEVCEANGVLFLEKEKMEESDFYEDGLHLNESGHEKFFQKVKEFLSENKWI